MRSNGHVACRLQCVTNAGNRLLNYIKATLNGRTVDGVFRNTEVFTKQAGTWRCVFKSSHTGGGAAGRDPMTAVAGRVRRAASRTAQSGVERQLAEPAAAPDPAHMELMAHRAGRAGEPGRSAKSRVR
jgi:hypothetical protein